MKAKPQPKQACINCHFLYKREINLIRNVVRNIEVNADARAAIRNLTTSEMMVPEQFHCSMQVWAEVHGLIVGKKDRHRRVVETDRTDFCFFWPYHPGMLLPAAETLQRREAEAREAARDTRLTMIGLWIAAVGLAIGTIVDFVALGHDLGWF